MIWLIYLNCLLCCRIVKNSENWLVLSFCALEYVMFNGPLKSLQMPFGWPKIRFPQYQVFFIRSVQFPDDPPRWSPGCTKGTCGRRPRKGYESSDQQRPLAICKLMTAALSHVTYIGGIKHVKKPHPYHFGKKKKKKKWVKGDSLCSILLVGSEIQFLEGSCSMYKALPIPPQKMALYSDV